MAILRYSQMRIKIPFCINDLSISRNCLRVRTGLDVRPVTRPPIGEPLVLGTLEGLVYAGGFLDAEPLRDVPLESKF